MANIGTEDIERERKYIEKIKSESKAFQALSEKPNGKEFLKNIDSIFETLHGEQLLIKIKNCFREYTDHSMKHAYSVLLTMEGLVFNIYELSALELTAIILSAILHDVGMYYDDSDFEEYSRTGVLPDWAPEKLELLDFEKLRKNTTITYAQEYIVRLSHGRRSGYVMNKYKINASCCNEYLTDNYSKIIEFICASHQLSYNELIAEYERSWPNTRMEHGTDIGAGYSDEGKINVIFICMLLRIADLLDFDAERAPKELFNELHIQDPTSQYEWKKNGLILNHAKVREFTALSRKCPQCGQEVSKEIYFTARRLPDHRDSDESEEYFSALRGVKQYISYIEEEISAIVDRYNERCHDKKYIIYLYPKVTFEASDAPDAKISFNYGTIVEMLLTESVYGEKRVGLREMIQNAMDACRFRYAYEGEGYNPIIRVIFNYDTNQFILEDNGRGMTMDIIQRYFLKIGGSIYNTDEYKYSRYKFSHAGHFGIGFFATFMLSNKEVVIETSYMGAREKITIKVSAKSEFYYLDSNSLRPNERAGFTRIILSLSDVEDVFSFRSATSLIGGSDSIISYIENNFLSSIDVAGRTRINFRSLIVKGGEHIENPIEVPLLSGEETNRYVLDRYLDETQLRVEYSSAIQNSIQWRMKWYRYDHSTQQFKPCDARAVRQYKQVYYLRIDIDGGSLYLFVPSGNDTTDQEAFEYRLKNSQRLVSDATEKICSGRVDIPVSFEDFGPTQKLFQSQNGFVCLKGCFEVYQFGENTIYINSQQWFEDELPTTKAIKSGINRCDHVYIRNIKIPQASITLPYMVVGINDTSFQFPHKVTVNINKRGIIPKTNRNELDEKLLTGLSYAVGYAYMRFLLEQYFGTAAEKSAIAKIVECFYPNSLSRDSGDKNDLKSIFINRENEE